MGLLNWLKGKKDDDDDKKDRRDDKRPNQKDRRDDKRPAKPSGGVQPARMEPRPSSPPVKMDGDRREVTGQDKIVAKAGEVVQITRVVEGRLEVEFQGDESNLAVVSAEGIDLKRVQIKLTGKNGRFTHGTALQPQSALFDGQNLGFLGTKFSGRPGSGTDALFSFGRGTKNVVNEYCSFDADEGPWTSAILYLQAKDGENGVYGVVFRRTLLDGITEKGGFNHPFFVGASHKSTEMDFGFLIEESVVDVNLGGGWIEAKSKHGKARHITMMGRNATTFRLRNGEGWVLEDLVNGGGAHHGITVRDCDHEIINPTDLDVVVYAGKLEARKEKWLKSREPGGGQNWMTADNIAILYPHGGAVVVGKPSGGFAKTKPSRINVVGCNDSPKPRIDNIADKLLSVPKSGVQSRKAVPLTKGDVGPAGLKQ